MKNGLDYKPATDEIWPPPPTLPPPELVRSLSFMTVRGILIGLSGGLLSVAVFVALHMVIHGNHFINWSEVAIAGLVVFVFQSPFYIFLQYEAQKKHRRVAMLKAEALTAQEAVEQNKSARE